MKLAVLVSGNGSNLQALIDDDNLGAEIVLVLSNNPDAFALERAKKAGIDTEVLSPKAFNDRQSYDRKLVETLKSHEIDLVVLAGYMLLCSEIFVDEFYGRLINIHPALLPAFPGTDGIGDALKYGAKVSGVTVHFVDKGCDTGPIIFQEAIPIKDGESKEELAKRIHAIEHKLLPKAVKYFAQGRLRLEGRKVVLK